MGWFSGSGCVQAVVVAPERFPTRRTIPDGIIKSVSTLTFVLPSDTPLRKVSFWSYLNGVYILCFNMTTPVVPAHLAIAVVLPNTALHIDT